MKKILSCALLGAVLASAASAESSNLNNSNLNSGAPVVWTKYGKIAGARTSRGVEFLGIPYAKAPVGELRWRGPQKPAPWGGVKSAETYAPRCLQGRDLGSFAREGGSEDCLYLNIFAPKNAKAGDNLPVLFWIHGGEFVSGSGADYDPRTLVESENIVVVTFNYRLGVLGFLATDGLNREKMRHTNYGLMDQAAALDFTRENIRAFGGDPRNIAIAGEGAGAQSVFAHMISPYSQGKFAAAIAMSGAGVASSRPNQTAPYAMKEALALGNAFARKMGCAASRTMDSLAAAKCLRAIPASEIVAAQSPYTARAPIIDEDFVPMDFDAAFERGAFAKVPLINGSNLNEGGFFAAVFEETKGRLMEGDDYENLVRARYGARAGAVLREYPLTSYHNPASAWAAVLTDSAFACPALKINRLLARKIPVFAYEFADTTSPVYLPVGSEALGAAHTHELGYIFTGFKGGAKSVAPLNAAQNGLAKRMKSIWAHARDAHKVASEWEKFLGENFYTFTLPASKMRTGEFSKAHKCDFWLGK